MNSGCGLDAPEPRFTPDRGERLGQLIDALGGLAEAARIAGSATGTLADWREGRASWDYWGIVRMCRRAGRSADWLIDGRPMTVDRDIVATTVLEEAFLVLDVGTKLDDLDTEGMAQAIRDRVLGRLAADR